VASASIVFVGIRRTVLMLHEKADVAYFRWAIDRVRAVSLPPEPSARLIADVRKGTGKL
jgi:hypothetical protein